MPDESKPTSLSEETRLQVQKMEATIEQDLSKAMDGLREQFMQQLDSDALVESDTSELAQAAAELESRHGASTPTSTAYSERDSTRLSLNAQAAGIAEFRSAAAVARDEMLEDLAALRHELDLSRTMPVTSATKADLAYAADVADKKQQMLLEVKALVDPANMEDKQGVEELRRELCAQQVAISNLRRDFAAQQEYSQQRTCTLDREIIRLQTDLVGVQQVRVQMQPSTQSVQEMTQSIQQIDKSLRQAESELRQETAAIRKEMESLRLSKGENLITVLRTENAAISNEQQKHHLFLTQIQEDVKKFTGRLTHMERSLHASQESAISTSALIEETGKPHSVKFDNGSLSELETRVQGVAMTYCVELRTELMRRLEHVEAGLGRLYGGSLNDDSASHKVLLTRIEDMETTVHQNSASLNQLDDLLQLTQGVVHGSEKVMDRFNSETSRRKACEENLHTRVASLERRMLGLSDVTPDPAKASRPITPVQKPHAEADNSLPQTQLLSGELKQSLTRLVDKVNRTLRNEETSSVATVDSSCAAETDSDPRPTSTNQHAGQHEGKTVLRTEVNVLTMHPVANQSLAPGTRFVERPNPTSIPKAAVVANSSTNLGLSQGRVQSMNGMVHRVPQSANSGVGPWVPQTTSQAMARCLSPQPPDLRGNLPSQQGSASRTESPSCRSSASGHSSWKAVQCTTPTLANLTSAKRPQ